MDFEDCNNSNSTPFSKGNSANNIQREPERGVVVLTLAAVNCNILFITYLLWNDIN
jgi:hypothetical protein